MIHTTNGRQPWSHWSSFVEQPGTVLDAIRAGSGPVLISLNGKTRFQVRRADRKPPGADVVASEDISRKRRDMRYNLLAGEVCAITRYGTIEAVIEGVGS